MNTHSLLETALNNATEAEQIAVVSKDGEAIYSIKNPSEAVQMAALQNNIYAIRWIRNSCESAQLFAIQKDPHKLRHILAPTHRATMIALLSMIEQGSLDSDDTRQLFMTQLKRIYQVHPDWDDLKTIANNTGVEL